MNYFTRTRVLIAIIVVLAITLLAALGTMVYGYYKQKQITERFMNNPGERMERQAQFIRQRLNLTPEQEEVFRRSRDEFHEKTFEVNKEIEQVSVEILNEISAPEPDQKRIESLVNRFGELHKIQKQIMVEHLMQIKNACTPEQFGKFQRILKHSQRRQMQRQQQRFQFERMRRGDSIPPRCQ